MNEARFKRFVIEYYSDLPKMLRRLDIEPSFSGLFFCPMHDNYNTPAAKLFKDPTGYHFYCFSERRMYSAYDVYKEVFKYNMNLVFEQIWNGLSETERKEMENLFGESLDEGKPPENIELYQMFKNGQISYLDLIQKLEQKTQE